MTPAARPPLSRDRILDAALTLIDDDGLAALSMRRLGEALGVEAMSLYHHVASKAALLDGVHERILTRLAPPPADTRDWQAYVRHQARSLHATLCAHPRAIGLFAARPAATAASIARLDAYLTVLRAAGFPPLDALMIVQIVAAFVVGHAQWVAGAGAADEQPASPPVPPALTAVHEVARAVHAYRPDRELELGLDALLTGFADRLPRKRRRRS